MTDEPRQRLERVAGSRRVRLTAVPGTTPEPDAEVAPVADEPPASGPNDERMLREVPPHY